MKIHKSFRILDDAYLQLQYIARAENISESEMIEKLILERYQALEQINKLNEELEAKNKELKKFSDALMQYSARLQECETRWKSMEASMRNAVNSLDDAAQGLGNIVNNVIERTSKQTAKDYFLYSVGSIILAIVLIAIFYWIK